MIIDAAGLFTEWPEIPLGGVFRAMKHTPIWCIKVATDDRPDAAIAFSDATERGGKPSLSVGAWTNDPLLYFPLATIRLNWANAVSCSSVDLPRGAIRAVRGQYLLLASVQIACTFCFDLVSGLVTERGESYEGVFYPSWSCGIVQDDVFKPFFGFPE